MDEELHLLEVDQAGELKDDLLRVHTKPLTLPPDKLTLVLVYLMLGYSESYLGR